MAITEYPKQVVRVEHNPDARTTGSSEVLVCADGSRWVKAAIKMPITTTGVNYAVLRGNQIHRDSP